MSQYAGWQAEDIFALDNGVWFVWKYSEWSVERCQMKDQKMLKKIPADNSAYNTKYVYVYESTPHMYMLVIRPVIWDATCMPTIVYGTDFIIAPGIARFIIHDQYMGFWFLL